MENLDRLSSNRLVSTAQLLADLVDMRCYISGGERYSFSSFVSSSLLSIGVLSDNLSYLEIKKTGGETSGLKLLQACYSQVVQFPV